MDACISPVRPIQFLLLWANIIKKQFKAGYHCLKLRSHRVAQVYEMTAYLTK